MRQLLTLLLVILMFFGSLFQGCVHYVEEPTPPGRIAEPKEKAPLPSYSNKVDAVEPNGHNDGQSLQK